MKTNKWLVRNTGPIPWLPPAKVVALPDRGEVFIRHHQHVNPNAPTLLLLHGWTASSDTQFFTAYEELAKDYSFIGIDHRGHGRGLRPNRTFSLEECADDAAALVRFLAPDFNIDKVITVGYSMGGPISLHLTHRHPDLVAGMVLQATAMEWRATRRDRLTWMFQSAVSPLLRNITTPRVLNVALNRTIHQKNRHFDSHVAKYIPWLIGEIRRNDGWIVSRAGRALATYDSRDWAGTLGVPAAYLLTTKDQLVTVPRQRELAAAMKADVVEIDGDHLVTLGKPAEYSAATAEAVRRVLGRVAR
jgi:pimeloyl-ACP methyl ester carboxylesterase